MAIPCKIEDGAGSGQMADVQRRNGHKGLVVLMDNLRSYEPLNMPFINPSFGADMNKDVTFGGSPEIIHDGGDTSAWTPTAVQGTWDFADTTNPEFGSGCVSLTNGVNGDEATFADATELDMAGRTALTGSVRIESYSSGVDIGLRFRNNGVLVGNEVVLDSYVDVGLFNEYQMFSIPKGDMGITTNTVDELSVFVTRSGGTKPTFRLDSLQVEETGSPLTYTLEPTPDTRMLVDEVAIVIADNVPSTVTNGTVPGLSYNKMLGVDELPIGIVFQRVRKGELAFSATIKSIGDSLKAGGTLASPISDGVNTCVTLSTQFYAPLTLSSEQDDRLTITINDDLSGLLVLRVLARGRVEGITGRRGRRKDIAPAVL